NKNSELVDNPPRHPSSGSPAEDSAGMISEPLGTVPGPSVLPQFYSGPSYLPYSSIGGETTPNGGGTAANGGGTAPNGGGTTPNNETTPIVTPEPGTFLLVGAGVVVIGLYRLFRRKRTKLD
ncbi:MAG TPA: PEP-CTERM sorting domain-containing protein, partial [Syntrophales bacterium]